MKKFAKLVQADARGQIVIPKDVRKELGMPEGGGFWLYILEGEGILLKMIKQEELAGSQIIEEIKLNANKIDVKKENIDRTINSYKKGSKNMEDI